VVAVALGAGVLDAPRGGERVRGLVQHDLDDGAAAGGEQLAGDEQLAVSLLDRGGNLLPWDAAYRWYRAWTADGTWDRVHDALRDQVRIAGGRDPQPSAGVLDAQSILTGEGGTGRGYDAGKRTRGRKRHIVTDTLGLLLVVMVTSASVQDRHGGKAILQRLAASFPSAGLIWADAGYANTIDAGLVTWARTAISIVVQIVKRSDDVKGFQVLPRRWVVERTFGWLIRNRRLSRDYERLTSNSEAMIKIAMIRLMAIRLAGQQVRWSNRTT
jgi:transposase